MQTPSSRNIVTEGLRRVPPLNCTVAASGSPGAQSSQAVEEVFGWNVPFEHCKHCERPEESVNSPAAHEEQPVAPPCNWNVPATQAVQPVVSCLPVTPSTV